MTQKFVMGVPLYRQEQEWKRQGIELSRQTMSNWLIRASEDWLEPIYERLHKLLCAREVLHADETTLQILREIGKTAQSPGVPVKLVSRGGGSYMWLYRTSGDTTHPIVLFAFTEKVFGALPARRQAGDIQQPRRAQYQALCHRTEEFHVRQHVPRRAGQRNDLQPD